MTVCQPGCKAVCSHGNTKYSTMELKSRGETATYKKIAAQKIIVSIFSLGANFQLCIDHASSLQVSKCDYKLSFKLPTTKKQVSKREYKLAQ